MARLTPRLIFKQYCQANFDVVGRSKGEHAARDLTEEPDEKKGGKCLTIPASLKVAGQLGHGPATSYWPPLCSPSHAMLRCRRGQCSHPTTVTFHRSAENWMCCESLSILHRATPLRLVVLLASRGEDRGEPVTTSPLYHKHNHSP